MSSKLVTNERQLRCISISYAYLYNSLRLLSRVTVPALSVVLVASCAAQYNAAVHKLSVYCALKQPV
jgi:hypothetical protein